jgi:cytochrome c553
MEPLSRKIFMTNYGKLIRAVVCCIIGALAGPVLAAVAADSTGQDFFEKKIRPVLTTECYRCHSNQAAKLKGGLSLDSREGMLTGGDTGAAITPGDPARSLLIKAIQQTDKDLAMPPKKKLDASVVADFSTWIKMGAPWPEDAKQGSQPVAIGIASTYDKLRHELWSWQPIAHVALPMVTDDKKWAKTDLDRVILANLNEHGLKPSPMADKTTLLRRATLDLTGLPPTPQEVEAFLSDTSPDAFAQVVDRLLASPHFGERWGRHWLDVARYAESSGMTRNFVYYYAWRYRDYVINAFNQDKPYNQFVTEQLAGDLLPANSSNQRDEHLVATGFLAIGSKDFNEKNPQQFLANNVDEQIDTTTKAFLATTVACARCHDHKFDPIPTAEYYSLAGIFRSTNELSGLDIRGQRIDKYSNEKYLQLSGFSRNELNQQHLDYGKPGKPGAAIRTAMMAGMRDNLLDPNATTPKHFAMGVEDAILTGDARILQHGEIDQPGPKVARGFLTIPCMGTNVSIDPRTSGRLELAQWITNPSNPLTARVMANRIWQHLFGQGIVKSTDNFGSTGDKPTNPQLLDYLATQFAQNNNWSIKKTIREIMLSSTYQQSSDFNVSKFQIDPDNTMYWRMNQRRLEGEAIRDAILTASGRLDPEPPSGSVTLNLPAVPLDLAQRFGDVGNQLTNTGWRSVYLPIYRNDVPSVLEDFDMADPAAVDGTRDVTTVAPQALFMMNSAFVTLQAKFMTQRLDHGNKTDTGKIKMAYQLALGRQPNSMELGRALDYIHQILDDNRYLSHPDRDPQASAWGTFCQALFACAEFRYVN